MTDQKITMDGKWAYRRDPYTQVRILCVDAPGGYPVVSLDECGDVETHCASGAKGLYHEDPFDLVPLQEKRQPREVWVVEYLGPLSSNKQMIAYDSRNTAEAAHDSWPPSTRGGLTRFREVMDEE